MDAPRRPPAVEQRAARQRCLVEAEAGRSQGQKRRAGSGDLRVAHQRTDPLDGDLPVALEGPLDCVGKREIELPHRPSVLSGPKRSLGDRSAEGGFERLSLCSACRRRRRSGNDQPDHEEGGNRTRQDVPPMTRQCAWQQGRYAPGTLAITARLPSRDQATLRLAFRLRKLAMEIAREMELDGVVTTSNGDRAALDKLAREAGASLVQISPRPATWCARASTGWSTPTAPRSARRGPEGVPRVGIEPTRPSRATGF